jgi:hypothetical protein
MLQRGLVVVPVLFACSGGGDDAAVEVANTVAGCQEQFSASRGYGYQQDETVTTVTQPPVTGNVGASSVKSASALQQALDDCESGGAAVAADANAGVANTNPNNGTSNAESTVGQPGTDCDRTAIMTHESAVCSARAQGLAEGVSGYSAVIAFSTSFRRIVWLVENVTARSRDSMSGFTMTLDAITAEVLDLSQWTAAR